MVMIRHTFLQTMMKTAGQTSKSAAGQRGQLLLMDRNRLVDVKNRQYSNSHMRLADTVEITFAEADGTKKTVSAEVGQDLLTIAHSNDIELEGACGGELACSTCHLVFPENIYETLPEKEEEEEDMLDLAFEVTETSRLGCQVLVRDHMEGMTVQIPDDDF